VEGLLEQLDLLVALVVLLMVVRVGVVREAQERVHMVVEVVVM
jgi:hypothetical protein